MGSKMNILEKSAYKYGDWKSKKSKKQFTYNQRQK